MHISEINIYPIKSLKGISLDTATVEERGLQFDRRWMLVDENNRFLTQREYPVMATLCVAMDNGQLTVDNGQFRSADCPLSTVNCPLNAEALDPQKTRPRCSL